MKKREMPPVHPGKILKELFMDPLGISSSALADNIGVTRKTVSGLVSGRQGVSVEMALRLSKSFNTSAAVWINMQTDYDLWEAEKNPALMDIQSLVPGKKFAA